MSTAEELFAELFTGLPRLAPGSDEDTARALAAIGALPPGSSVADIGCGMGRSTLQLAEVIGGSVVGIDNHEPYLEALAAEARRRGLSDTLSTRAADMNDLPLDRGSLDLLWSEGAIYIVGFESGLAAWREFLKPDGWLAVTELTWLTDDRPSAAVDFWSAAYPAMTTVESNLLTLAQNGYAIEGVFSLPGSAWEEYYGPLERRLQEFEEKHVGDHTADSVAAAVREEIEIYQTSAGSYSYVFYVARRVDS